MAFGNRRLGTHGTGLAAIVAALGLGFAGAVSWQVLTGHGQKAPDSGAAPETPAIVVDDSALKAFPNTTVTYYDVPGTDTAAIVAYIGAHGPVDSNDHTVGSARTHWQIRWRWRQGSAACDKDHVEVTFRGEVLLPRLVDATRLRPDDAKAWQRFYDALVVHEAGHLRHAYQHIGNVAAAIRSATCENAPAAAGAATQALADYDAAYDRETRHGYLQGVRAPGL
ncbi:DUF922 domain-containing protein [Asticcacaulis solisilvae]|uniref:DUF922 domain-containing protein n=1 Tax=Asticcacaulis solisilvae TaxID=1217274 RepID=UPI003FD702FE